MCVHSLLYHVHQKIGCPRLGHGSNQAKNHWIEILHQHSGRKFHFFLFYGSLPDKRSLIKSIIYLSIGKQCNLKVLTERVGEIFLPKWSGCFGEENFFPQKCLKSYQTMIFNSAKTLVHFGPGHILFSQIWPVPAD